MLPAPVPLDRWRAWPCNAAGPAGCGDGRVVRGRQDITAGRCPSGSLRRAEGVRHGERRRELERRFPGWEIWYVPREPDRVAWRARPRVLINADDPEDLAAAIRAAEYRSSEIRRGWPPGGLPGAEAAARRAEGAGRVRLAAGEGPPNAPGAAPGFPAEVPPGLA